MIRVFLCVAQFASSEEVLVAFRGSTATTNFQTMFNLGLVPLQHDMDSSDTERAHPPKVHEGYQLASMRLYEVLRPPLEAVASGKRITFMGHSYGGGTATLCALYHCPDALLTLSAPLVGDAAFARHFDAVGVSAVHLVHDADPVLQQNRPLWLALGFQHTGRVVPCSPDERKLFPRSSEQEEVDGGAASWPSGNGGVAWNFLDHTRYLGTYLGPRFGVGRKRGIKWTKLLRPISRP